MPMRATSASIQTRAVSVTSMTSADVLRLSAATCEAVGRPYASILRTHSTLLLLLAETDADVQVKVDAILAA